MMLRWIKAVCIRSLRPRGCKTFGHVFSVHKFKLCSIILTILESFKNLEHFTIMLESMLYLME